MGESKPNNTKKHERVNPNGKVLTPKQQIEIKLLIADLIDRGYRRINIIRGIEKNFPISFKQCEKYYDQFRKDLVTEYIKPEYLREIFAKIIRRYEYLFYKCIEGNDLEVAERCLKDLGGLIRPGGETIQGGQVCQPIIKFVNINPEITEKSREEAIRGEAEIFTEPAGKEYPDTNNTDSSLKNIESKNA